MAKLLGYAMALVLGGFWPVPLAFSGPDQNLSAPPPSPSFEADLLRIDGNRYVVKDSAGVERQISSWKRHGDFRSSESRRPHSTMGSTRWTCSNLIIVRSGTP